MFGWTLIRKSYLKELKRAEILEMKFRQVHLWFSGWTDLDIIWDYLSGKRDFRGNISDARIDYAQARGTDVYGHPKNKP